MNILVTGANGQLGKSIRAKARFASDNYIFTDVQELDITDPLAVESFVDKNNIDLIVNCAAYTNVDAAEDNQSIALKINGEAPAILAKAIKKNNGLLIHISTDYVFGGANLNQPVKEDQPPCPTGVYGKTKWKGEEEILKTGASAIILRTAWLYSNFGNNFVDKIISLLQNRDEVKVVFDQCGSPTYASDLADAIVDIIENRKYRGNEGVYHFSNEGVCSWFDFAHAAVNLAGLKEKKVSPCHSSEFPSKVIRPPYSVLDKSKYKLTFNKPVPHWFDSLKTCIAKKYRE